MCCKRNESIICRFGRKKELDELYRTLKKLVTDSSEYNEKVKKIALQLSLIRIAQSGDRMVLTTIATLFGGGVIALILSYVLKLFI